MDKSHGIITEDPAVDPPIGTKLQFRPVCLPSSLLDDDIQLAAINNWEAFEGVLLSIHFHDMTAQRVMGSGVLVAPGIALCAKHVIAPEIDKLIGGTSNATCTGYTSNGLLIWRIKKVNIIDNSDFVILGLALATALPPESTFNLLSITTRLPQIGEKLLIAGFRSSEYEFVTNDSRTTEISGAVYVSLGQLLAIHLEGTDSSFLPWPVLEINAPSLHGMSGGPVFDSAGFLVGILTASIDFENNEGVSYVSLLFPALSVEFEGGWPELLFQGKRTLLEMDRNVCFIDNPAALTVEKDLSNGTQRVHYSPEQD